MKSKTLCTNCFKSLGVPTRMEIFRFLAEKHLASVTSVVEHVGLTQPTVSYHLSEMKDAGILSSEKNGKEVYYKINPVCPHEEKICVLKNIGLVSNDGGSYASA